ncbi:MAG: hypothetical protein M3203_14260, partial [Actinomycetota bacterium]|nr:hypothetical protein [Actinomycetota bacterium]
MLAGQRRPGARRFVVGCVVFAVMSAPLAVAGWLRLNQPAPTGAAGRFDPNIVRTVTTLDRAPEVTTTTTT